MPQPRDPATERLTAKVLIKAGQRSGEPEMRAWALDYAAKVDAEHGKGHEFGREVLRSVLAGAHSDYFVRTGVPVPGEDSTGHGMEVRKIYSEEDLSVLNAVVRAFGASEWGVSVTMLKADDSATSRELAVASFDFSLPGIQYVETAYSVISWPRKATLFI